MRPYARRDSAIGFQFSFSPTCIMLFDRVWTIVLSDKPPCHSPVMLFVESPWFRSHATEQCFDTSFVCAQFGRDAACVLEEMLLSVISEAEEKGSELITEKSEQMVQLCGGSTPRLSLGYIQPPIWRRRACHFTFRKSNKG